MHAQTCNTFTWSLIGVQPVKSQYFTLTKGGGQSTFRGCRGQRRPAGSALASKSAARANDFWLRRQCNVVTSRPSIG
eukprot:1809354-Pleurochrysis_carterae.AAC.1